jgi:hypothetical protein
VVAAQHDRGQVPHQPVHQPGRPEPALEGRAALDQHLEQPARAQLGGQGGQVDAAVRSLAEHEHLGPGRRPGPAHLGRGPAGGGDQGGRAGLEQPGPGRHAPGRVQQHPQRLALGASLWRAGGQPGVVGQGGAGADHDGVGGRPEPVAVGPGGRAGDPLGGAVGRRDLAVQAGGALDGDAGPAQSPVDQEGGVLLGGRLGPVPELDRDAGGPQPGRAAPGHERVGVDQGGDHAADAGGGHGVGAGRGAAVVGAGLEGDVERGPGRGRAGRLDGQGLGVGRTGGPVPALPHHAGAVRVDQHGAHHRVGAGRAAPALGQLEGPAHPPGGLAGHSGTSLGHQASARRRRQR